MTKEVLAIYAKGKFQQYLLKSEAHYIPYLCTRFGVLTVKLEAMTKDEYKIKFGK